MKAISLTTGKEMWLPPLQHKLEPLSSTLHGTCQHLSLFYVTLQEAPITLEHVHTVWETCGIWSIIFENCITNSQTRWGLIGRALNPNWHEIQKIHSLTVQLANRELNAEFMSHFCCASTPRASSVVSPHLLFRHCHRVPTLPSASTTTISSSILIIIISINNRFLHINLNQITYYCFWNTVSN